MLATKLFLRSKLTGRHLQSHPRNVFWGASSMVSGAFATPVHYNTQRDWTYATKMPFSSLRSPVPITQQQEETCQEGRSIPCHREKASENNDPIELFKLPHASDRKPMDYIILLPFILANKAYYLLLHVFMILYWFVILVLALAVLLFPFFTLLDLYAIYTDDGTIGEFF